MIRREFAYDYLDKHIPYTIWFTHDSRAINTAIFLGSVQVGKLPEWVAEACPPKTAIVQGAPHWYASEDGSDIPDFMFGFTQSAFDQIMSTCAVDTVHVVADSQAVPGVIKLFTLDGYRKHFGGAVFIQPLGLTARIFRGSDERRMKLFKKRVVRNGYHQLISLLLDNRLRYNHRQISKIANFKDPIAAAQYNSGLKYDALPDIQRLAQVNDRIFIICGSDDKIFPANEIRESFRQQGIELPVHKVKRTPHCPLATKKGRKLLRLAFELLFGG